MPVCFVLCVFAPLLPVPKHEGLGKKSRRKQITGQIRQRERNLAQGEEKSCPKGKGTKKTTTHKHTNGEYNLHLNSWPSFFIASFIFEEFAIFVDGLSGRCRHRRLYVRYHPQLTFHVTCHVRTIRTVGRTVELVSVALRFLFLLSARSEVRFVVE